MDVRIPYASTKHIPPHCVKFIKRILTANHPNRYAITISPPPMSLSDFGMLVEDLFKSIPSGRYLFVIEVAEGCRYHLHGSFAPHGAKVIEDCLLSWKDSFMDRCYIDIKKRHSIGWYGYMFKEFYQTLAHVSEPIIVDNSVPYVRPPGGYNCFSSMSDEDLKLVDDFIAEIDNQG